MSSALIGRRTRRPIRYEPLVPSPEIASTYAANRGATPPPAQTPQVLNVGLARFSRAVSCRKRGLAVFSRKGVFAALLCMILIALFLIPQPMCAFWVALACASIDFGVIGYMTLWNVKLVSYGSRRLR